LTPGRVHIVVNPFSSGGKTGRRQPRILDQIARRVGSDHSVFITTRPLDAEHSTRSAIEHGAELVLVVGGDGTVHEVVNGFARDGVMINPSSRLGIIGSGTAQDVIRSFKLPTKIDDQIETACGDHDRLVDVGKVSYVSRDGRPEEQHFFNECQQGIAAVVVQRFQAHHKWMGGFLGFGLTAVTTAARHREQVITVVVDDKPPITDSFLGVVISNGGFAGGGMNFAPKASVDDGLLDIVLIHKQRIPSRLVNFPKIYSGRHINLSWISYYQGKNIRISSAEQVPVEADGEFLGYLPCTINILSSSLRLKSRI
jgi:YegS/Rv2252/BmrU family lipid kinase